MEKTSGVNAVDLLFQLGEVLDLARNNYNELVRLREENETLRQDYAELLKTSLDQAKSGTRNALLTALAMSGDEGRKLASAMADEEQGVK